MHIDFSLISTCSMESLIKQMCASTLCMQYVYFVLRTGTHGVVTRRYQPNPHKGLASDESSSLEHIFLAAWTTNCYNTVRNMVSSNRRIDLQWLGYRLTPNFVSSPCVRRRHAVSVFRVHNPSGVLDLYPGFRGS